MVTSLPNEHSMLDCKFGIVAKEIDPPPFTSLRLLKLFKEQEDDFGHSNMSLTALKELFVWRFLDFTMKELREHFKRIVGGKIKEPSEGRAEDQEEKLDEADQLDVEDDFYQNLTKDPWEIPPTLIDNLPPGLTHCTTPESWESLLESLNVIDHVEDGEG